MNKTVLKYSYSQAQNGYIVSGYESIADSGEVIIPDKDVGEYGNLKVFGIGDRAFAGCNEITSMVIPSSITEIGKDAFFGCDSLTSVYISDLAAWCNISFGNSIANPLYYTHKLYLNETLITDLVIPEGVIEIKAHAFAYCRSLTSVTIPDSVTSIGEYAFGYCYSLTSVMISDNVINIGSYAFSFCTSLTSVIIPAGVESIGERAFFYCSKLTIYCQAAEKPSGWVSDWDHSVLHVVQGYTDRGIINDNIIWIEYEEEGKKIIKIIGYQGQPRIITLPEKINEQSIADVNGFAQCKADIINIHCDAAVIASNAFKDSDNITFRYFTPINRTTDNYPYGANTSTRVYMGMPYQDMDFLGFTFNGKHSYLDLGVLRTINDRMQHSLSPEMNDITADNPGGEGMYYFGSRHKSRKFTVDFAFDHLTEQQMRDWKKFCSNKELSDLIFDEEPYKVYTAKITGAPILKTIPFEEDGQRIYKGEGTLEFTCYWPYAHTPDENTKISEKFIIGGEFGADGKSLNNYLDFLHLNKDQWATVSGLQPLHNKGMNPGDISAPFVYQLNKPVAEGTKITIGNLEITIGQNTYNLKWDSKTGIVSGTDASGNETKRKPVPYSGNSLGGIPVGGTTTFPQKGTLTYHYWYY